MSFLLLSLLLATLLKAQNYQTYEVGIITDIGKGHLLRIIDPAFTQANSYLSANTNIQLVSVVEEIDKSDAFEAYVKTLQLIKRNVTAIVGPYDLYASEQVQAVCAQYGIPYLYSQWGYRPRITTGINLLPEYSVFGSAIKDFINSIYKRAQVALIYYDEESIVKLEYFISSINQPVIMRKWEPEKGESIIKFFNNRLDINFFLIDIPHTMNEHLFSIIKTFKMEMRYNTFFFIDLDFALTDPKIFGERYECNITGTTLLPFDASRTLVLDNNDPNQIVASTRSVLMKEGIHLLAMGIERMSKTKTLDRIYQSNDDSPPKYWGEGLSLSNIVRTVSQSQYQTGLYIYDNRQVRIGANISMIEYKDGAFKKFAQWDQKSGVVLSEDKNEREERVEQEIQGKLLKVTTMIEPPFVVYNGSDPNNANETNIKYWTGFCIEILRKISENLKFNVSIQVPPDKKYGKSTTKNGKTEWNGMIGELMSQRAHMAVASLTITLERERVIDFTTPFMDLGVSILYKKPKKKATKLFAFLEPLSTPVWGYVLAAYIMVSFALFFIARFSPFEWYNPYPCNVSAQIVENNFSMLNSLWFTIGSLMQQGSDIMPRATSTRIIAGFWWFFTLIIISSYTANLAAFLTTDRMVAPVNNVEDLARQTKIKYGTISMGSSAAFFETSEDPILKRMSATMTKNPSNMVETNEIGIRKVIEEDYAFILESSLNEYVLERNCDLMKIGQNLDSKGYAIGLPTGSPYRSILTREILKLQQEQHIERLKNFWWKQYNISKSCQELDKKISDTTSLGMEQLLGVFVMLLVGLLTALSMTIITFIWNAHIRAKSNHRTLREEMAREFRFAMARSNKRNILIEQQYKLPPLPKNCCLPTMEEYKAGLAYGPCLSSITKPEDLVKHNNQKYASEFKTIDVHEELTTPVMKPNKRDGYFDSYQEDRKTSNSFQNSPSMISQSDNSAPSFHRIRKIPV